jgi:hypothetical protein
MLTARPTYTQGQARANQTRGPHPHTKCVVLQVVGSVTCGCGARQLSSSQDCIKDGRHEQAHNNPGHQPSPKNDRLLSVNVVQHPQHSLTQQRPANHPNLIPSLVFLLLLALHLATLISHALNTKEFIPASLLHFFPPCFILSPPCFTSCLPFSVLAAVACWGWVPPGPGPWSYPAPHPPSLHPGCP